VFHTGRGIVSRWLEKPTQYTDPETPAGTAEGKLDDGLYSFRLTLKSNMDGTSLLGHFYRNRGAIHDQGTGETKSAPGS
jgi:hypothetical protein